AKFLSVAIDYTQVDGKAYFLWQHKLVRESTATGEHRYEIRMSGPLGAAKFDGGKPVISDVGSWKTVVVPLLQADWYMTSGTWSGLLSNVTSIQIDFELVQNTVIDTDVEAIDNIKLISVAKGVL